MGDTIKLDQLDIQIIEVLRRDGRAKYTGIAEVLGQNSNTIRHRVQRLQNSGAIQFLVYPNPNAVSAKRERLFLRLRVEASEIEHVGQRLVALPEISYISIITGSHPLLMVAEFGSKTEVIQFLTDVLGSMPEIQEVETVSVLRVMKILGAPVNQDSSLSIDDDDALASG